MRPLAYLLAVGPVLALAQAPPPVAAGPPALEALVAEAWESNPELQAGLALVRAEQERIPQASALPDPVLALGYQNDGFRGLQIGKMETSWATVMGTQALPWPGKRALRSDLATVEARRTQAGLERLRLGLEADVRRAYVDLVFAREQLVLLSETEALWEQAEALVRVRYETGLAPQSDLLRAQLERTRLRQRRWGLETSAHHQEGLLNRLRARPLEEPVPTPAQLERLPLAPPLTEAEARADAEARSPELAQARLGIRAAERRLDLARKEVRPDFAVSAGIMPRGSLDPMWQVGFSVSLPIFSAQKQQRAIAEGEARRKSEAHGEDGLRRLLLQRVHERVAERGATQRMVELFEGGLLVQSDAALKGAFTQYEVGRAPFASVLEALQGVLADRTAYLESLAQAHRLAISEKELGLEGTAGPGMGAARSSIPGLGAARGPAPAPARSPAGSPAPAPPTMSGM